MTLVISLRPEFQLEEWQLPAIESWRNKHSPMGPRHGIFNVFTGGGKTVLALGAMADVSIEHPGTKYAIVAPSIALASQWVDDIPRLTDIPPGRVGLVGGGRRGESFQDRDVLVFVLRSASTVKEGRSQLAHLVAGHEVMLVVDECHKAGAEGASKMFDAATKYRLGLSATPIRTGSDAVDEFGRELPLDQQRHGRALGPCCFDFPFEQAVKLGLLPRYLIHHHAIRLNPAEKAAYEKATRLVNDALEALRRAGGQRHYLVYIRHSPNAQIYQAALGAQAAILARKHLLYKASERLRVTERILIDAWGADKPPPGAMLFNERIGSDEDGVDEEDDQEAQRFGAIRLHEDILGLCRSGRLAVDPDEVAIEHSGLTARQRDDAVQGLRDGRVKILVTVKALQEGINVPDVGVGISVASTASARQRIQTMGRILRAKRDSTGQRVPPDQQPLKQLHLIYVADTVDEQIYKKTDWSLAMGEDRNVWYAWLLGSDEPDDGTPLAPTTVDEEEAWRRIAALPMPQPWPGPRAGIRYTRAQRGVSVSSADGPLVNQDVEALALLDSVAPRQQIDPRGRFTVTPILRVMLKHRRDPQSGEEITWALGKLEHDLVWDGQEQEQEQEQEAGPASRASEQAWDDAIELEVRGLAEDEPGGHGKGGEGWWYVLWQRACLAGREGDLLLLNAVGRDLKRRSRAAAVEAGSAVEVLSGAVAALEPTELPANTQLATIISWSARAYASGRLDLLHQLTVTLSSESSEKSRRLAVRRSLEILLGRSNRILLTE